MNRLLLWIILVSGMTIGGWVCGWIFGAGLARISYDYIIVPTDFRSQGLRLGLFAGTLIAACSIGGTRTPATIRSLFKTLMVFLLTSVCFALLIGSLAWVGYRTGLMDTSTWRLAHPQRHAVVLGLQTGFQWGGLLSAVWAGWYVWKRRSIT